jgi:hypothetical protein
MMIDGKRPVMNHENDLGELSKIYAENESDMRCFDAVAAAKGLEQMVAASGLSMEQVSTALRSALMMRIEARRARLQKDFGFTLRDAPDDAGKDDGK